MKSAKCFFCEFDRPVPTDVCKVCKKLGNFQLKKRMSHHQALEWELYKKRAEEARDMTPSEAIIHIKNHMYVHQIGEYPHVKLGRALEMAIEALGNYDNLRGEV